MIRRLTCLLLLTTAAAVAQRSIAITVDDLPAMNADDMKAPAVTEINRKILATMKKEGVPATGFVNESRLYVLGETDARIATLKAWLDAGFDLGNHTFSHDSLNQVGLKEWEDDVIQGESVTKILLEPGKKPLKYLRHPYLDTGADLTTRRESEAFLTARGYRIAPVTLDPRDWYFADLYQDAHDHRDLAYEKKIADAWVAYAADVCDFYEKSSKDLLGYEPRQVILLHATWIEADHMADLIAMLRKRGYTFVSLEDALEDPAYAQRDDYISDSGASWIDRWAITRNHQIVPGSGPKVPAWVDAKHKALELNEEK